MARLTTRLGVDHLAGLQLDGHDLEGRAVDPVADSPLASGILPLDVFNFGIQRLEATLYGWRSG
jgi:hypothetical protein